MVVAEGGLTMVVVPDNYHTSVVAPAIPQLGDMTTPIVVEDYIPLPPLPPPPRRSRRNREMKEKKEKNFVLCQVCQISYRLAIQNDIYILSYLCYL